MSRADVLFETILEPRLHAARRDMARIRSQTFRTRVGPADPHEQLNVRRRGRFSLNRLGTRTAVRQKDGIRETQCSNRKKK